jgi:5-methylcytosine-specific restriction endonuclease McrA
MSNTYGISEKVEKEIRARDKKCVYCRISMKQSKGASGATIEHFNNDGPLKKKYNVAICCRGCNSSKGTKKLLVWFQTTYWSRNSISKESVAKPVKEYIHLKELS